jgi:methyltransferase (TIGR00027 family)
MALFRALESARSPGDRIVDDLFAREFLSQPFCSIADLSRFSGLGAAVRWYIDRRWPGSRASGVARTRWIDDHLIAALHDAISQVAILGAGYDTRAYRVPGMECVRVFEVDHPNTSALKQERVRKFHDGLPSHVSFVAVDFNHGSLHDALKQAGFDSNQKTLFIWEGVTNYLTETAVSATLKFIGSAAPGSQVVFTYVHQDVLHYPGKFDGGLRLKRMLKRLEEKWTFGFDPSDLPAYLAGRGLRLIADVSSVDYRATYMGKKGRHLKGYEFYRVAVAEVGRAAIVSPESARCEETSLHA